MTSVVKRARPFPQLAAGILLGGIFGFVLFQGQLVRHEPAELSPVQAQGWAADGCAADSDCTVRSLGCVSGIIVLQQAMCSIPPGICATTPGGSTYGCENGQCVMKGDCSGTYYLDYTCNNACGASSSTPTSTASSSSSSSSSMSSSDPPCGCYTPGGCNPMCDGNNGGGAPCTMPAGQTCADLCGPPTDCTACPSNPMCPSSASNSSSSQRCCSGNVCG